VTNLAKRLSADPWYSQDVFDPAKPLFLALGNDRLGAGRADAG
jgi:hypothetical protein